MSDEQSGHSDEALAAMPWLRHIVTMRDAARPVGGDMSFATGATNPDGVIANRLHWLTRLDRTPEDAVMPDLVHGTAVQAVTAVHGGCGVLTRSTTIENTDGLITDTPGLTLMMCFGDCVPLVVVDTKQRVVGLGHAGWRGTLSGMAGSLVHAIRAQYGSDPSNLVALIGPSIGPEAYTVGPDVTGPFMAAYPEDAILHCDNGGTRLDLWKANARQLERAGLHPEHIHTSGICTYEHGELFFSHRYARAHGEQDGRFAVLLTIEG